MAHVLTVDGVATNVEMEKWRWEAHYAGGAVLKQFADDGVFHRIGEVAIEGLMSFKMVSDTAEYVLSYIPGSQIVHFYRNTRLNIGTDQEQSVKLYCFGYRTPTERVVQAIFPDGHIEPIT